MTQNMNTVEKLIAELCPNGVEFFRVDELCDISRGRVMSKDYLRENIGEYPVYSSQTVNQGKIGSIITFDYDGEYLTWTTDGANAGTIFHRIGKFSITNVCGLLKAKRSDINIKYIYYILCTVAKSHVSAGMGNPKLMSTAMSRIKIPLPPLPIQEEIVKILDEFTLLEAELEAELEARKQQYEYYESQLFSNSDYKLCKISDFCTVNQGLQVPISERKKESGKNRFFYITIQFLKNKDKDKFYIENPNKNVVCELDDILVTRTGSTGVIITGVEGCFHNNFFKVNCFDAIYKRYMYYILKSKKINNELVRLASGGAVPDLPHRKFFQVDIPIPFKKGKPDLEKQKEIVKVLDEFDVLVNDINEGLPAEIEARRQQYEYYRERLLTFKELQK